MKHASAIINHHKQIIMKRLIFGILVMAGLLCGTGCVQASGTCYAYDSGGVKEADICIYGATSGGIMAAYTARKAGKSVVLIEPSRRIGGLTAGGLGFTDIGRVEIIRGFALEFYRRVGKAYGSGEPAFKFEPKVALEVFEGFLREADISVLMERRIVKASKKGNVLQQITLEDASSQHRPKLKVRARMFIDCSYEGDLMARSGVSYTVGREGNAMYGEDYNGMQMLDKHQFPDGVDPYREKGNPKSGLLYGISPLPMGRQGQADKRVQAYNFRITMTKDPANRIPITRPERYDSTRYELLVRWKEVEPWKNLNDAFAWDFMPNNKTDINNRNGFSTDMIGANWDYPEASYKKRARIFRDHLDYTKGLLYFVAHDSRVPDYIRKEIGEWGYPKDEYLDSDHFTPQLYIREARRMIGRYVMTQANCQRKRTAEDPIGWAAYTMDSHNAGRFVVNGMVKNEGDVQIYIPGKYNVSYRSITPKEDEAANLLVPVCLSASHIAYGSIRMEPVFMVLGETSALAACQALDEHGGTVQKVDSKRVMDRMESME